jgi:YVTN family beta-propeller protein
MDRSIRCANLRRWLFAIGLGAASVTSLAPVQAQQLCGGVAYPFPYTDVASVGAAFCPGIMEAYVTGVSKGTSPTTFSPNETVPRLQMATFLQRSLDQGLSRGSRRTVLKQSWQANTDPGVFSVTGYPIFCAADGQNIWVTSDGIVTQVQASTGQTLGTWTGVNQSWPVIAIPVGIFVATNGSNTPGLFYVDPSQPPGEAGELLADGYPGSAFSGMAYDGANIWIADFSGSVWILQMLGPIINGLSKVDTGFNQPVGALYDGAHVWVTDYGAGKLFQLDPTGAILKSISVGAGPEQPVFDGENIWVPSLNGNSITVVQASTGNVVATIASDGINLLDGPEQASFDGERILITNSNGNSVTIFKAADLSVIANISTGSSRPYGACSDGINFWVTLANTSDAQNLLKF